MSDDPPICHDDDVDATPQAADLLRAVRAAVLDLERVAEEANYAARRARSRLTELEMALKSEQSA